MPPYKQLVTPNLGTAGNVGYCLAFAESAFSTPHLYPYAWTAWEATQFKHTDQNFPDGMYVPMWFSYALNGVEEGHVAIHLPDGRILSSPWENGTTQAILPNLAELESIYSDNGKYPVNFVGWSEDIAGIRVVESIAQLSTITPITPKQVQVTSGKQEWNLSLSDLDTIAANPFTTAGDNQIITAVATLNRSDIPQFTYYLENLTSTLGWNTLDCTDYTPPPPPVVPSKPYVVPAAPQAVTRSLTYKVLTQLRWYTNNAGAQLKKNAQGVIPAGTYYQFNTGDSTVQLGNDNMHALYWINTTDNVEPVVVPVTVVKPSQVPIGPDSDTAWKSTYKSFHTNRASDPYKTLQPITMKEYSGKRPAVVLDKGQSINVVGTFVKEGITFYRPRANNDEYFEWYYGIPLFDDNGVPNLTKVTEDVAEVAERKLRDYYTYWKSDLHEIWDVFVRRRK